MTAPIRRGSPALLVLAALAAAQEPPPPPAPAAVLAALRSPTLTLDAARQWSTHLPSLPVASRLQAIDALRGAFLARLAEHGRDCQQAARQVGQRAAKDQQQRLGRNGAAEVEQRRAAALAISRRADLTKEAIEHELDPLRAELEELLLPAGEPPAAVEALRLQRAGLQPWFDLYVGATAGLELHPDAEKYFAKSPPPEPPPPVAALHDELQVWALLGLPLAVRDRRVLEANEALRRALDPEEAAGTTELNRLRYLLGLPLVRIDDKLTRAARDHSADMATLGFFDHTSPVPGKRTPADRAARFGTSGGAENIAAGHDTGAGAIRGWWYSPGHHRNMLGNHARTGLGRSAQLWTQLFGG